MKIFTIGYGRLPFESLAELLMRNGVSQVADVRSTPFDRRSRQYNQRTLEKSLPALGIRYIYLGEALGSHPQDPSCYRGDRANERAQVDYAVVMQRPWFRRSIEAMLVLAQEQPTALMCWEESPANCHRHLLIGRYLKETHPEVEVLHILADGSLLPE